MARKDPASETKLAPPMNGHNYDPAQRAEFVQSYYRGRKLLDDENSARLSTRKLEDTGHRNKVAENNKLIKGLSIDVEDADEGYAVYCRLLAVENAANEKAREEAQARLDLHTANRAECIAVAQGVQVGQLNLNLIMEAGARARGIVAELDSKPKVNITGGAKPAKDAKGSEPPRSGAGKNGPAVDHKVHAP